MSVYTATIVTKFLGHTNTKPARVKAQTRYGQSVTIPYQSGLTPVQNACAAATFLIRNYNFTPAEYIVGQLGTDNYAFIMADNDVVTLG